MKSHRGVEEVTRDPEVAAAEAELAWARETMLRSVADLQREIVHTLDWRAWVRRRPVLAVVAAFGIGVLFGRWRGAMPRNHGWARARGE
jgi:hypothetical protein